MIDVLGPEKRRRRTTQEKIAIVQQSFEPGMTTVPLLPGNMVWQPASYFSGVSNTGEGSLTAVAAGEQVIPASELAAAMKQIKELQRLLGKKRWKMNSLKKPLNMGEQKVDSARALIARGDGE